MSQVDLFFWFRTITRPVVPVVPVVVPMVIRYRHLGDLDHGTVGLGAAGYHVGSHVRGGNGADHRRNLHVQRIAGPLFAQVATLKMWRNVKNMEIWRWSWRLVRNGWCFHLVSFLMFIGWGSQLTTLWKHGWNHQPLSNAICLGVQSALPEFRRKRGSTLPLPQLCRLLIWSWSGSAGVPLKKSRQRWNSWGVLWKEWPWFFSA